MVDKPFLGKLLIAVSISLIIALVLGGLFVSCPPKSPCEDIEERFESSTERSLHIYIDDSESMKGFVRHGGSKYLSFVRQYLPSAIGTLDYRVFGFGSDIVSINDISKIARTDFYDNRRTVFSNAFNKIIREQPEGFVIVSDMVISVGEGEGGERVNVKGG